MNIIKPLGDRLLVKLRREEEKKIGNTVITLAHSDKKRVQPESAIFVVVAVGSDVPDNVIPFDMIIARTDAGVVVPPDATNGDSHRLYRLLEFPEVMSTFSVTNEIAAPEQVIQEKVVIKNGD